MSGYWSAVFRTSLGWAGVVVSEKGIAAVVLPKSGRGAALRDLEEAAHRTGETGRRNRGRAAVLRRAVGLLRLFFDGHPEIDELPIDLRGHTEFQRSVWRAARGIPYGETRSYGWIARRIGRPRAARAVGQALGANPVPVLVP